MLGGDPPNTLGDQNMLKNTVKINNYDYLEWYISDQHIPALVTFLDSIGKHITDKPMTAKRKKQRNKSMKSKHNFITNQ